MRQLRITVEYDGTELGGWQRQPNAPTVQGHLERALAQLLEHPVRVSGASRTDAGVHARGQVAAFSTERTIPAEGMRRALNVRLPDSIAVSQLVDVEGEFHPRFSATGKHYRYLYWLRRDRSPHWRHRAWHRSRPLDVAAMQEAAKHLVGEHDFAAFRATGCSAKTTTRSIRSLELAFCEPGLLAMDIRGNAFMRNMVRIIAGTLADVGEGRFTPGRVAEILASLDRTQGGQTAPAHGLELMEVFYEGRRLGPVSRYRAKAPAPAELEGSGQAPIPAPGQAPIQAPGQAPGQAIEEAAPTGADEPHRPRELFGDGGDGELDDGDDGDGDGDGDDELFDDGDE